MKDSGCCQEIKERLNRYHTMLSSLHEGVILLSNQGDVIECNQSAADLLELPYSTLKSMNTFKSDWKAIKSNYEPYLQEELPINRSLTTGETIHGAIIGLNLPHHIRWLLVNTRRIQIPELPDKQGGLITFTDTTKAIEATQQLQLSEQRYKTISEMTSDFIFYVNVETKDKHQLVWTSGSLQAILELPPLTHIDLPYGYVARVHPDDRTAFTTAMASLYQNKVAANIHRIITATGYKWVECHLSPIYSAPEKRVTHLVGSIKDITAQKQAELKLHELSQEIIQTQEKERSMLARELHDNVGQAAPSILLHLKNLQRLHQDEETKKIITIAEAELRQMNDSIRLIHSSLEPKSLNVLGLPAAVKDVVTSMLETTSISVKIAVAPLELINNADHQIQVFRIIQEAVRNTLKHAQATKLLISAKLEKTTLALTIQDNGCGFNPTEAAPYRHYGLSIMAERIALIGGTMHVDSQINKGTTLHFTIPL